MTPERARAEAPGPDPDADDVAAAQRDRAAFAALYRRYVERVYGYCFYILGDHHDAEDATERAFLSALGAIDRFSDRGATFRAWLFRIAHNEVANALRRRRRHRTTTLDTAADPVAPGDPWTAVEAADERRLVREAISRLPRDRRQVLVLRFVDGLSSREVASVLGRSEGAVRVLQHRALRDLAVILGVPRRAV
jgi:RNA polymerase sigma-70 factor, ECF subfamily